MTSRVARKPLPLPKGVTVTPGAMVEVKGPKGATQLALHPDVTMTLEDNVVHLIPKKDEMKTIAITGTMRAILGNMVHGVTEGYEIKLLLVGVGYRAQAQGRALNLSLGFSHPVVYNIPASITISTPSQTEIIVQGVDKQLVGQVAADIRAYRSPEPYKGKGVRYADEQVVLKETKKK